MEIWKRIEHYPDYEISNLGNIKSYKRSKVTFLKYGLLKAGYYYVRLCEKGIIKNKTIHSLVAEAFLGHNPCGYDLVINHINFNKTDNRAENLEIVTQRDNANKKHVLSTSKFTGVSWSKKENKWKSTILVKRREIHLGFFVNEIDAKNKYEKTLSDVKNGTYVIPEVKTTKSKHKGVCYCYTHKKWTARRTIKGKRTSFGYFLTEQEAIDALIVK